MALPRAECSVGVLTIPEWRLIKPGEVVGEVALFAGRMRSATVVAARESAVAILQYDAIAALGGKLSEAICTRLAAVAAGRVAEDVPGPLSPVGATTTPRHPQSSVRRVEAISRRFSEGPADADAAVLPLARAWRTAIGLSLIHI